MILRRRRYFNDLDCLIDRPCCYECSISTPIQCVDRTTVMVQPLPQRGSCSVCGVILKNERDKERNLALLLTDLLDILAFTFLNPLMTSFSANVLSALEFVPTAKYSPSGLNCAVLIGCISLI